MTMVRLRCPKCSSVFKIGEDVVARHPVMRCSQCQGLVNVTSDRVPTVTPSTTPQGTTRSCQSSSPRYPFGMVVGIPGGLLLLAGFGVGMYYLKNKHMLDHAKLMVHYETQVAGNQAKPDDNPFKDMKPKESAKGVPENPFKPASPPEQNTSPEIDNLLDQLKSKEFSKRIDGVKEITSMPVVESRKKAVLDALLIVLEDNEIHQKQDVFKACRKWATTEEDRELIGQHAETLLKDHWCKKDALRYFGDNQVVSASKEVARLLKDNFERKEAAECLITMGNVAQKAVMPHLTDLEPQVRYITIDILARIGDKDAIPELQKVQNDRLVGTAARQAIKVILSRNK